MRKRAIERGRLGRYRLHTVLLMPFVWLLATLPMPRLRRSAAGSAGS
jgi:hypothetical protein